MRRNDEADVLLELRHDKLRVVRTDYSVVVVHDLRHYLLLLLVLGLRRLGFVREEVEFDGRRCRFGTDRSRC